MLEQVLQYLRNWFCIEQYTGTFVISGGSISLPFMTNGQYYRIIGSLFNDGLHKYGDATDLLTDETFDGGIWALAVPRQVVSLATEINTWQTANAAAVNSPFQSESFGGYSYQKNADGAVSWQTIFAGRLKPWRKI